MILASCPVNSTGSPHDDSKKGGGELERRGGGEECHMFLWRRECHMLLNLVI